MTAGRPPIPAERKALHAKGDGVGSNGHRSQEVVAPAQGTRYMPIPPPPARLKAAGRNMWRNTFAYCWWMRPEHVPILVQMCKDEDRITEWERVIAREGYTSKGSMGQTIEHPLSIAIHRAEDHQLKRQMVLGLTPTDRAKLNLTEVQVASGLADLQHRTRERSDHPPIQRVKSERIDRDRED